MTYLLAGQSRRYLFVALTVVCTLFSTGYVIWSAQRAEDPENQVDGQLASAQNVANSDLAALQSGPYMLAVDLSSPETIDRVKVADLSAPTARWLSTPLKKKRLSRRKRARIGLEQALERKRGASDSPTDETTSSS